MGLGFRVTLDRLQLVLPVDFSQVQRKIERRTRDASSANVGLKSKT